MGREKTAKNQALTSAPVFWQNRACITAEQGLQRRRAGCQLSGTGKVVAKNRRCFLVEGHLEWIGRPSLSTSAAFAVGAIRPQADPACIDMCDMCPHRYHCCELVLSAWISPHG